MESERNFSICSSRKENHHRDYSTKERESHGMHSNSAKIVHPLFRGCAKIGDKLI